MNYLFVKTFFRFVAVFVVMFIILSTLDNPIIGHISHIMRVNMDYMTEVVFRATMSPFQFTVYKQKQKIVHYQKKCSKKCNKNLDLINVVEVDEILLQLDYHKLMFFLETSGSSILTIRQACAIESAVARSGRTVVLLMTSDTVNVCSKRVSVLTTSIEYLILVTPDVSTALPA